MVGKLLRPYIVVTILCLVYCLAVIVIRGEGDPLILMTIGSNSNSDLSDRAYSDEGYDGQFTYYIAQNPETASQYIDVPAYRFQRILLPISGRILALGQQSLIPFTLLVVNLIALAGGTYILEQLLMSHNISRWFAIGYGLSIGVFGSARLMTTETLAYALVLLAIWLYQRDKWQWSAMIFALSVFSKEVTLIFVAGYILYLFTQKEWKRGLLFGLIAGIPFALWQLVLFNWFGAFGIGSGGNLATGFEIIPFMGFIRILTEGGIGIFAVLAPIIGAFVILPMVWGLRQCWKDYQNKRWSLLTWLLFVNSAIMLFVPFSTYREPLGILRFIVGLQICVILYSAKNRKKRALMNSTIWFITTLFVVMSDFT
jgi:hypothetical protein